MITAAPFPLFRVIRTGSHVAKSSMAPKRLLAAVMVRVFMGLLSTRARETAVGPGADCRALRGGQPRAAVPHMVP